MLLTFALVKLILCLINLIFFLDFRNESYIRIEREILTSRLAHRQAAEQSPQLSLEEAENHQEIEWRSRFEMVQGEFDRLQRIRSEELDILTSVIAGGMGIKIASKIALFIYSKELEAAQHRFVKRDEEITAIRLFVIFF